MPNRSQLIEALVLKRRNVGEADRVVTLLTKSDGKVSCLAKGIRKITSSRAAALEPGNVIKGLLVQTSAMPLLTQASLVADCQVIHSHLPKMRQLFQVLEIVDRLFVEEAIEVDLYNQVLNIRSAIVTEGPTSKLVLENLGQLLVDLGYQHPSETPYASLSEYVSVLADKPLKSWEFLAIR